ncbi:hypothetical protein HBI06_157650 [Parastagonospora nodorum]|nr:hypothetical protein HBI06_157650 [Parastagonospora nodorum]KAH4248912.1 hypothetical protein HBI05_026010 [Parastagonospora nodorum]
MGDSAYTVVIYGKDATGKPTLVPALRAAGQVVYAREGENPTLEDAIVVRSFENFTLQRAGDDRATLPTSYKDKDGVHRRIVRIVLDPDLPVLQGRLAEWPSINKWESEKFLFCFSAFYGPPVVDTGKKSVDDIVSDIIALARNTEILALSLELSLGILTTACSPQAVKKETGRADQWQALQIKEGPDSEHVKHTSKADQNEISPCTSHELILNTE